VGGDPVGYVTTVRIPKADDRIGVLYIDEIYVLKAHRRRGIGSVLVQEVCRIGQELGLWRVRLHADENDPGICAFYEANGFRHSGNGFFQRQISNDR
jgi:ribosomal protein S18 acetylase RimI-like enzyme